MVALAVVAVLAMDAARLYSVKADMQRVVNAAATAAADEAQACSMNADIGLMKARALVAARQVGFNGNAEELEVFAGVFEPAGDGSSTLSFTRQSDIDKTNAAVVRYKRQERLSWLLPEWLFPPVELSVNAGSRKELYAALSASASTLNLEGGLLGNLLGAVLGQSNYSLDPISLQSLESTLLRVGDLLTLLGLADVTALLNAPLVDVLDATVDLVGGVTTPVDRKSTRLNSSHVRISYAVFCLKKKKSKTVLAVQCVIVTSRMRPGVTSTVGAPVLRRRPASRFRDDVHRPCGRVR